MSDDDEKQNKVERNFNLFKYTGHLWVILLNLSVACALLGAANVGLLIAICAYIPAIGMGYRAGYFDFQEELDNESV